MSAAHGKRTSCSTFCPESISNRISTLRRFSTLPSTCLTEATALLSTRPKLRPAWITNFLPNRSCSTGSLTTMAVTSIRSAAATSSRSRARMTPIGNAVGFDFTRGPYLHSLRFAYDRYSNKIVDAVAGSSIFNPAPGLSLNFTGGSGFASGHQSPSAAADQAGQQTGSLRRHSEPGEATPFDSVRQSTGLTI